MRIAFVTNICAHYRVKTFESLASYHDVDFYFFSAGDEWYWQRQHGVRTGSFRYKYLPGFRVAGTRVTPTLLAGLLFGPYDVYVKCINGKFALPLSYLIARLNRRPFVLWTGIWMRLQTRAHRVLFPVLRYVYCHADAIVVYGEHVKRYLVSEGVSADRIFVAPHAVDNDTYGRDVGEIEKASLRQELEIEPDTKVVLYLGRLEEGKGLSYLIEAFAALKRSDTVLVVAGAGGERDTLEKLAREKGVIGQVRFPGYVDPERTATYYSLAYLYVLPSVTTESFKEPWGLVVNEAFNQGVPVLATDAVGAAAGGLVQDGVNGFIVPERNSGALTRWMQLVLDVPDVRHQLASNARQEIAHWTNERMVAGFREAIASVALRR